MRACSLRREAALLQRLAGCTAWPHARLVLRELQDSGQLAQLAGSLPASTPGEQAAAAAAAGEPAYQGVSSTASANGKWQTSVGLHVDKAGKLLGASPVLAV